MILGRRIAHTIDFSRAIRIGEHSSLTFTPDSGAFALRRLDPPLDLSSSLSPFSLRSTCFSSEKKPNANRRRVTIN